MAKEYIILHHSATEDGSYYRDFDSLLRGHLARGYRDIGYHYVIEKVQGELAVIPGRAEWEVAAACPGRNSDSIHICIIGNFEETIPSDEIHLLVAELCKNIMIRHPIKAIYGHRDHYPTLCPGRHFDVNRVRDLVKGGGKLKDKHPCIIDIKGTQFPGYVKDGVSYFSENVPVREVVQAVAPSITWDEKSKTVKIN